MGTSTHNSGQKGGTPLIPSWLDDTDDGQNTDNAVTENSIGDPNRFTAPRGEFTRYINSGGRDGSMARRSVSNYVRNSLGGTRNATKRLGAARQSSAKLLSVAGAFAAGGAQAVERLLSIDNLSRKSAQDAFIAIADFICPDGGTQDEGIARSAYIEAIEESPEIGAIPFENLSAEQMLIIVEKSMANAILGRLMNDIGNKTILLPDNVDTANHLISSMKEYIRGGISDAVAGIGLTANNLPQNETVKIIDQIYETAFEIIAAAGDDE